MGTRTHHPDRSHRKGFARGVRAAGLVALLAVLVAVPVALAGMPSLPSSSTAYDNFAYNGNSGDNHWSSSDQTVTIQGVPSETTATLTVHFSSDSGAVWTQRSSSAEGAASLDFLVSSEGSHRIEFWASDSATATAEATHTPLPGYVNIDKTAPLTTPTGLATTFAQNDSAGWSNSLSRPITLSATDPVPLGVSAVAGVKQMSWTVNGGSVVTTPTVPVGALSTPVTFTLVMGSGGALVEGSNAVAFSAIDWASNRETTHTAYVNVDTVAPTTTASPALASTANSGWYNTLTPVTLTATDTVPSPGGVATTGVESAGATSYRVNGGNRSVYDEPIALGTSGSYLIQFWSTDRAGNIEALKSGYMNIDTTLPSVSANPSPQPNLAGWNNTSPVYVDLSPFDAPSGIAKTQCRLMPLGLWVDAPGNVFAVSEQGASVYDYRAVDNAGNMSSPLGEVTVKLDTVAPVTTGGGLQTDDHSGWRNSSQEVTLTASDATSGVPEGGTTYRVNGSNPSIYFDPFTVSASGSTPVTYFSVDRAGNVEAIKTGYVNIETTPPTVTASISPKPNANGWNRTAPTVSLVATDTPSGVAATQYHLSSSSETWIDAPGNAFVATGSGALDYAYRALDNAGNSSAVGTVKLKVDTAPPRTYASAASGKTGKPITLKYKITDAVKTKATSVILKVLNSKGDLVRKFTVSGNKNLATWYSLTWTPSVKGTFTYYVYAKDLAGNNQNPRGQAKVTVK